MMTLEVVWNGVNDGRDGDLLCAPPLPVKRPPPEPQPRRSAFDAVCEGLRAHGPVRASVLAKLVGTDTYRVHGVLRGLREAGRLGWRETGVPNNRHGVRGFEREYWLVERRSAPRVDAAQVAAAYRAGQTQAAIAASWGVTPARVCQVLKEAGVERRVRKT